MRTLLLRAAVFSLLSLMAVPALAGDLQGRITDRSGGALPGARVVLLNVATGQERSLVADATGQFAFADLSAGTYRVAVSRTGFSDLSRTILVAADGAVVTADFALEVGALRSEVTVTVDRGARAAELAPVRVDVLSGDTIRTLAPTSTGDALLAAPGVTPVGSGPFQVRPRLRGLDSTRVLVLVDGERLNNARTATDRAGVEVGLVDLDTVEGIEVLGGAGSVLYGTDALSGTINFLTNRARFSEARRFTAGFDGFYSSNEHGRRGSVTLGVSDRRWAVNFTGGTESFDDYRAGRDFTETSTPYFANATLVQADTIDTNFGFNFRRFPDPFNAPFTRTSAVVGSSGSEATSANLTGLVRLGAAQTLEVKYLRRHAANVGFPDFVSPYFFQSITLPWSRLDKISATYTASNLTPWMRRLTIKPYFQQQDRLLRNQLPVQFPAPTANSFFPISVFRLDIVSDTRQQVWTPGVDVQATFQARPNNLLTAGISLFRDRSEDERTTSTTTSRIGAVTLGQFGPAATVFASPIVLGPPSLDRPVRVPDASFRNVGLFVHDEWDATADVRITTGLRLDGYRVATDATPGYEVASLAAGARPAIDPATLPSIDGDRTSRTAVTGEAGVVLWSGRAVSPFAHYVHSYRHPNLEELLFSGPATAGNILPNVQVKPETGNNVDVGARVRLPFLSGSVAYFHNTYDNFISTEFVATAADGDSIYQAINLAKVRIQGLEAQADVPFTLGGLVWAPFASLAYTRGTVLDGTNPSTGTSLAGAPQDNITPSKVMTGLRVADRGARWWGSYSLRAQGEVSRISPLLSDSPFLIAQDLLALGGFTLHRVAAGYDWRRGGQVVGLTLAVDNLTDVFYREQFQFAPARGRTFTVALRIRGGN